MKRHTWLDRLTLTASVAAVLGMGLATRALGDDATGSIKGTVKFVGDQKAQRQIDVSADPFCAKVHAAAPLLDERFVWGRNGTIQNVFVWVSKGLEGKTLPAAAPVAAEIHQNGCSYHPHVQGVVVNQEIKIINDDNTLHNVQVAPTKNPPFNEAMPVKDMMLTKKFAHAEMPVTFKCAVHPWMTSYVMVMENPFFAVSGKDGTFEIKGLPPGEYELSFWQEFKPFVPDQEHQTIKVEAGKAAEVTVSYSPKKKAS